MFTEDDLLPLSGLQHLAFCPRQCALIHIEQQWAENRLTAEGKVLHDRAHEGGWESRPGLRIARGLRIRSLRLGLIGQADVVEFRPLLTTEDEQCGLRLPDLRGRWQATPVEYKRGRAKHNHCDEIQICAQALCLEEMLGGRILEGFLFYGQPRRRTTVPFSEQLRGATEQLAGSLHELIRTGLTPPALYSVRCESCSLKTQCLPEALAGRRASSYWRAEIDHACSGE